jgi:phosphoenolpyruvate carboxylase
VQAKLVGKLVRDKYNLAVDGILAVTGQRILCEASSTLRSLLLMRKPYLDPINLLQVDILQRVREKPDDEALRDCLLLTINGIAAGMRNTG